MSYNTNKNPIIKFSCLFSILSYAAGNFYYPPPSYPTIQYNNASSYPKTNPPYTPCKSKINNKAPVYDLCFYKKVEYEGFVANSDETVCNLHGTVGNYVPENNVPSKFLVFNGLLFFSIKRLLGTFSTLNVINLNGIKDKECPLAKPYPTVEINELALPECADAPYYLTNVHDFDIDKCGILYALDVGSYCNNTIYDPVFVQKPRIYLYNTAITNALPLIKSIEIPEKYYTKNDVLGFTTILVNAKYGCEKVFVYVFNTRLGLLLVYSTETGIWSAVKSTTIMSEPFYSRFPLLLSNYMTNEYVVADGISATLDDTGITYTSRAGFCFYHISFEVLHNPQSEYMEELNYNIVKLGCDYEKRQDDKRFYGRFGGLVSLDNQYFAIQELNHAVLCFTPKPDVSPDTLEYPVLDREEYPFLSDLQLYSDNAGCQRVYFMSTNLIYTKFHGLDEKKDNIKFNYIDLKETLRIYPQCKAYKPYAPPKYIKPYEPSCHSKGKSYVPNSYQYQNYKPASYYPNGSNKPYTPYVPYKPYVPTQPPYGPPYNFPPTPYTPPSKPYTPTQTPYTSPSTPYVSPPTPYVPPPTSYVSPPTSYVSPPTSYVPPPTPYTAPYYVPPTTTTPKPTQRVYYGY